MIFACWIVRTFVKQNNKIKKKENEVQEESIQITEQQVIELAEKSSK